MGTIRQFLWCGLVVGRRAADCGSDVQVFQYQPVVAVSGVGLVGESSFIEYREHELAGGVAGKGPSSAVRAMGAGSQAHDEHPRLGIAEAGHGLAPVLVVAICPPLLTGYLLAIGNEARAAHAG